MKERRNKGRAVGVGLWAAFEIGNWLLHIAKDTVVILVKTGLTNQNACQFRVERFSYPASVRYHTLFQGFAFTIPSRLNAPFFFLQYSTLPSVPQKVKYPMAWLRVKYRGSALGAKTFYTKVARPWDTA